MFLFQILVLSHSSTNVPYIVYAMVDEWNIDEYYVVVSIHHV